jgi:hypothetical protein
LGAPERANAPQQENAREAKQPCTSRADMDVITMLGKWNRTFLNAPLFGTPLAIA